MRLAAVAVALLLAGCAQPGDDEDDDPLFGLCPQWAQGPGSETGSVQMSHDASAVQRVGDHAEERHLDRPLDLLRVRIDRIDVAGVVELRAEAADGQRLTVRDYRLGETQMVAVANLGPDAVGNEFDVFLSAVLEDAPPAQRPASLNWTVQGTSASVDYSVTYHYKVCGA